MVHEGVRARLTIEASVGRTESQARKFYDAIVRVTGLIRDFALLYIGVQTQRRESNAKNFQNLH